MPIDLGFAGRAARIAAVALGLLFLPLSAGAGATHLGPSTLDAPLLPFVPEIRSNGGVASLSLRAALDPSGRPAFFWNGREIAPTIRVHPGDAIRLHYTNALPEYCGLGMTSDSNLHFHGLETAPEPPGDEVISTNVAPNKSYDYVVKIDPRQAPGLYWYHPHPHGLTNWQIGNGMSGAIVVEGIADRVPALAGVRERVIVLRDVPHDPSVAAADAPGQLRPSYTPSGPGLQASTAFDPDEQTSAPCGVENDAQPTINGIPSATIGIRPREKQLWRILNASGKRHYDLAIQGARMQLVAEDGVPLRDYPGAPSVQIVDHVVIPPGGRAEVMVVGPVHPALLVSRCFRAGLTDDPNPGVIFGELVDDGGGTRSGRVSPPLGLELASAKPPAAAARRTIRFDENARGFSIGGVAYDPRRAPSITARAGTTEEWTLQNDTDEVHVFHLHQVHFVVESTNGARERSPRWRDTIDLPPQARDAAGHAIPSKVKVLVDFRDPVVRGTFLLHCHITDHEDGGMMAKVRVI